MVSVPVLPALSLAVTVMVLSPLERVMLETDHEVVPVAVPFPPLLLLHVTLLIPLALSNAVPSMLIVLLVVVYVELDVGVVIIMVGIIVSRVISSEAVFDTFPELSLYHTYTALLPSPLLTVYETSAV